MKRVLLAFGGLVLAVSFLWTGTVYAASMKSGNNVTVPANETVNGSLYAAGSKVTIAGTVRGDVFCAAQNVEITGTVQGDVLCAAQNMTISGMVDGDVRAAAQTLSFKATTSGSATLAGQAVTIAEQAKIGRDATVYGQTLQQDGQITRDLVAGGQFVTLNGPVGRDAQLDIQSLQLASKARIGGNLTYTSDRDATEDSGATVVGTTEHKQPSPGESQSQKELFADRANNAFYFFAAMLLVGLALRWLAPKSYGAVRAELAKSPWQSMLAGAAVMLLGPLVVVLLAITGFGLLLAVVAFAAWCIAILLGLVYGSYILGHFVLTHTKQPKRWVIVASLITGLLLIALTMLVPVLGPIVTALVLFGGLGSLLRALGAHRRQSLGAAKHHA